MWTLIRAFLPFSTLLLWGCSSSPVAPADSGADLALRDVFSEQRGDLVTDSGPVAPEDYCERMVETFCRYYLRCGRMVASDQADCRATFLQTCNARYEPYYRAMAEGQLLELDQAAIPTCEQHLTQVPCEQQIHDLDGPCALWRGTQPAGSPCGLGIDSLVCAPGTECALVSIPCGVCKTVAPVGGDCSPEQVICGVGATCRDERCVERAGVGEVCGDGVSCIIGASCEGGRCAAPSFVTVGDPCDNRNRCPYRSTCVSGSCRLDNLLGSSCGAEEGGCASGRCNAGTCDALLASGEPCGAHSDCLSTRCLSGHCDALPGSCFVE